MQQHKLFGFSYLYILNTCRRRRWSLNRTLRQLVKTVYIMGVLGIGAGNKGEAFQQYKQVHVNWIL
jgi:hypothetical protein